MTTIKKIQLGQNGPLVSKLGLGCMRMSSLWGGPTPDETESITTIQSALDSGINFLNTGDFYGAGHNELLVGKAIKGRRDDAFISVKFGAFFHNGQWLGLDLRPVAIKNFINYSLTHIVDKQSKAAAEHFRVEYNISPAYDYVKQNILNSLKSLFRDHIKSVLLKEHYRCHPTIIGFCNKKYYNNKLVIMTSTDNHPFRIIETNISGEKGNYNQRQIDETDFYIRENYSADYTKVGVVTPYRNHAVILKKQLPFGAEADTIHKFQGREKDVIIFNTVKNKIGTFIDNPNLVNVAVSRAVKEFIVVKPESMDLPHGTNIGDLIRYICYTTDPAETIVKGSICSVFDLLYKEYNKVFVQFLLSNKNVSGSPAELIIHKLLGENILLNNMQFSSIDMVREYRLRDLIRDFQPFSEDEMRFIRNNSRIDFLLYNKIDKTPVLAIEVDGVSFHDNELQQERDSKKNHILETIGLPLLRLSTGGHNEETRIIESLSVAMGLS
jgi:hypothetical protein